MDSHSCLSTILRSNFPVLQNQNLLEILSKESTLMEVQEEMVIMEVGDMIRHIPLVVKGGVKVFREDDWGHMVFLYYIKSGESCAMTLSSCLKKEKSRIKAIAQEGTEMIAVPAHIAYKLNRNYPLWQDFVLSTYGIRFDELLTFIDSVCFQHMDARLLGYLNKQQDLANSSLLILSHQQIAADLNSSREVISRLLKQLEKSGAVSLHRGKIELLHLPK